MENQTIQKLEKTEEKIIKNTRKKIFALIAVAVIVLAAIGGFIYWNIASSRIYVENSVISASVTNLPTITGGILQQVFVNIGDTVQTSAPIARVGNELIKAKSDGQILSVNTNLGASFTAGQTVATMINPDDLRVVGQVQEDKGLKDISVGQEAVFTVDAFGPKQYSGIVDQINPTSNAGDIVFNISNTRQENDFDIKVRFNINQYPELKNGMSAKLWIYK
jgi:multidrug resistance efflux pump